MTTDNSKGPPAPADPRRVALAALCDRAGNVTAHLNRLLAASHLPVADAALARELALGVVRHRGTLDAVLAAFQRRPGPMPARIRATLRLGLYQLLFMDRVPAFAAVNEAVEQVGPAFQHLRGFVNGLLRSVARSVCPPQPIDPAALAASQVFTCDVLLIGPDRLRRFDAPVFPDPASDLRGYLAAAFSLPEELAARWLATYGGLTGAVPIALHANARPPLVLRVNTRRASVAEVLEKLGQAGVDARPHANGLSVVLCGHADLTRLEVFTAGLVQPQDAAATAVVAAADVRPGMAVLDLCAAPGTKTTHLAERMDDRGRILAVDVSQAKLARIRDNCRRLGVTIVQTLLAEQVGSLEPASFDLVLVDAPCSNTGVLARRPEARWRFSQGGLDALARDQVRLLGLGVQFLRPGGSCVYATCSLEEQENQQVVRQVLRRAQGLTLRVERAIPPAGLEDPAAWSDGGYLATLQR